MSVNMCSKQKCEIFFFGCMKIANVSPILRKNRQICRPTLRLHMLLEFGKIRIHVVQRIREDFFGVWGDRPLAVVTSFRQRIQSPTMNICSSIITFLGSFSAAAVATAEACVAAPSRTDFVFWSAGTVCGGTG